MQRSIARREGSPFTGLGPVFMKEFSDHLSSARMMVLMLFVIAFGALTVAPSLTELRNVTEADPFLFLRIFTSASSRVPFSFTAALGFTIPLLAIGLGFDSVNGEFNRRTLSRVLSQPIYRDALLLGKFLGALATLAVALVALWLIVLGAGLLLLGIPPRGVEVARGVAFLGVAIAYGGVWLAASMLFSVIFRSTATSALMRPGRAVMTSTREPRKIASSISWVTNSTVLRSRSQTRSSSSCINARVWLSSAPNGSSSSRIAGSLASARAMAVRCCMPPESCFG